MQIDITSVTYITAIVQAVLLIVVIVRKPRVPFSEKLLVAVLLSLSITLAHYVIMLNGIKGIPSLFMDVSAIAWYTISPLLYLYCNSLIAVERKWSWRHLIYFPFSIYLILQSVFHALGSEFGLYLLFDSFNMYTVWWLIGYLFHSLVFSIASIQVLQKASIAEKQKKRMHWLILFFKVFAVALVGLLLVLFWFMDAEVFISRFEYILLIVYAAFIFILMIFSLRFSHYFSQLSNDHYGLEQKSNQELEGLHEQLVQHMHSHKPFLNAKLTLGELSAATKIPENQLSQIFTKHLRSNFYQFVNTYRLQEFERQVENVGIEQLTIMGLAELSGFSSKATFYKVFKLQYGITPKEFIQTKKG